MSSVMLGTKTLIYIKLADTFIQSSVQNSACQGHTTNNRTRKIRYSSYRTGCKAICPVHKVDRPSL